MLLIGVMFLSMLNTTHARVWTIYTNRALVQRYTDGAGNIYRIFRRPAITVITPKSFSAHFFPQWETAKNLGSSYSCNAVINGTYFGFNPDWSYFPAWVRYQYWRYLRDPYQPAIDRNLRVLLSWNWTTIDPIPNDSFQFSMLSGNKNGWFANAGPWLVRDGKITRDIVEAKSHWQRKTNRVWFIRNPNGEIHFVVATEPISLPQFIAFSYWVGLWTWSFQFVNLDWWSSTTMLTPYNSYYSKKRLPSFICIH